MAELRPAGLGPADLEVSWLLAGLLAGAAFVLAGLVSVYQGWWTKRSTAAELLTLLQPYFRTFRPEGDGPFPLAVLVPGCVSAKDHADGWARHVVAQGWAALVVDSHTPRGWNRPEILIRICTGRMFWGTARAGDVLVALAHARTLPWVDARRIVLIGWSHGAWSIMDLLALDPPRRLPFNLTDLPEGFAERRFEGVAGLVLLYPYCGLGNRARGRGWRHEAPTLFLLAGADTIVRNPATLAIVDKLRRRGHPVEVHTLEGVNHGFDDTFTYPGNPLVHDPKATEEARKRVAAFLRGLRTTKGVGRT